MCSYFTGLEPDYLSSLCVYTRASYRPTRHSFLFMPVHGVLEGAFGELWRREFEAAYAERSASFRLERVRERYAYEYTYADLAAHLGIVYVPYQVP